MKRMLGGQLPEGLERSQWIAKTQVANCPVGVLFEQGRERAQTRIEVEGENDVVLKYQQPVGFLRLGASDGVAMGKQAAGSTCPSVVPWPAMKPRGGAETRDVGAADSGKTDEGIHGQTGCSGSNRISPALGAVVEVDDERKRLS
jgi:hypothetical protein